MSLIKRVVRLNDWITGGTSSSKILLLKHIYDIFKI